VQARFAYWYWMFRNIETNAIAKELDLMQRIRIGEAFLGRYLDRANDAETTGTGHGALPGGGDALTSRCGEGGRAASRQRVQAPGWSQSGGPWVKPERPMRYLLQTETFIEARGILSAHCRARRGRILRRRGRFRMSPFSQCRCQRRKWTRRRGDGRREE